MKYFYLLIFSLLIGIVLCLPLPPSPSHTGAYNTISHTAYCENETVCLHEIAHRLDQSGDYPSQSESYTKAIQMYLLVELRKPTLEYVPVAVLDLTYRNDTVSTNLQEIYAWMFAWSDGKQENMPDGLQKFYDWNYADQLLQTPRIRIFGGWYLPLTTWKRKW